MSKMGQYLVKLQETGQLKDQKYYELLQFIKNNQNWTGKAILRMWREKNEVSKKISV